MRSGVGFYVDFESVDVFLGRAIQWNSSFFMKTELINFLQKN